MGSPPMHLRSPAGSDEVDVHNELCFEKEDSSMIKNAGSKNPHSIFNQRMDHNITLLQRNNDETAIDGYGAHADNSSHYMISKQETSITTTVPRIVQAQNA